MVPSAIEITHFYEIALHGNISKAARKLNVSQPSLSITLNRLERNIGATLFVRNKQGVTLTKAGIKLLKQVKPLLLHWENTKQESRASHQEVQGEVVLGCHTTVALFLHQFLPNLLNQYPKLSFAFKHDVSQNTTLSVINSIVDIGIVVSPQKQPDLVIKKLNEVETLFWRSIHDYPAQDICSDQLVLICDPNVPHTQSLLKKWKKLTKKSPRIITSTSLEIVASLTAHGCGIGILPSCFTQTIYQNQLQPVLHSPISKDYLYLIYRKENKNVKAVTVVLEAIKKFLEKHP